MEEEVEVEEERRAPLRRRRRRRRKSTGGSRGSGGLRRRRGEANSFFFSPPLPPSSVAAPPKPLFQRSALSHCRGRGFAPCYLRGASRGKVCSRSGRSKTTAKEVSASGETRERKGEGRGPRSPPASAEAGQRGGAAARFPLRSRPRDPASSWSLLSSWSSTSSLTKKGAGARSSGGGGRSFLNEVVSTEGKEEDENERRRQFPPFFFHRFLRKNNSKKNSASSLPSTMLDIDADVASLAAEIKRLGELGPDGTVKVKYGVLFRETGDVCAFLRWLFFFFFFDLLLVSLFLTSRPSQNKQQSRPSWAPSAPPKNAPSSTSKVSCCCRGSMTTST